MRIAKEAPTVIHPWEITVGDSIKALVVSLTQTLWVARSPVRTSIIGVSARYPAPYIQLGCDDFFLNLMVNDSGDVDTITLIEDVDSSDSEKVCGLLGIIVINALDTHFNNIHDEWTINTVIERVESFPVKKNKVTTLTRKPHNDTVFDHVFKERFESVI